MSPAPRHGNAAAGGDVNVYVSAHTLVKPFWVETARKVIAFFLFLLSFFFSFFFFRQQAQRVTEIAQMFPDVTRHSIEADLRQTRNIQTTIDNILEGRVAVSHLKKNSLS